MNEEDKLVGKKILIVDDEKDVLDVLVDLLSTGRIDTASSFEEAKSRLENNRYDVVILDIMGVSGFDLLKIANEQKIPALMLTAHALSERNLRKSAEQGAAYYAPKDEISNIALFVADVIEAVEKKKNPWQKMVDRLGWFYDKRFSGSKWREEESEFWKKFLEKRGGI